MTRQTTGRAQLQRDQANKLEAQHQAQIDGQRRPSRPASRKPPPPTPRPTRPPELNKSETHAVSDEDARAADAQAKAADAAAKGEEAKLRPAAAGRPVDRRAAGGCIGGRNAVAGKQAQLRTRRSTDCGNAPSWAPAKGVVERMQVSVGEALGPNPQQPAVMFAADGPRIIRAEVEQEWANHVALDHDGHGAGLLRDRPDAGTAASRGCPTGTRTAAPS